MNFAELEQFLLNKTTGRYQRSNYDQFLKSVGFVFNIPSIHITGSNGKGSTCTFLANIYQDTGKRVGSFTSPFFYHPTEMIKVNGEDIPAETFLEIYNKFEKQFTKFDLSAFEIETFIALTYFNEEKCDFCVIEVGMGGLIDATNCFNPVLSIITSICLEHTSYLGTTYSEIAANKAGIIKQKVPVLIGKLEETAESTIREIALQNDSQLTIVDGYYFVKQNEKGNFNFDYRPYTELEVPVNITSQIKDACLAIEATKILNSDFPVSEQNIRNGLLNFKLICRGEWFGNVFIDGAHNVEAAENLVENFKYIARGKPIHILFASFRDKNIAAILPTLAVNAASINLTTFDHPRAREEMDYFLYEADYPFIENWKEALDKIVNENLDDVVLVTGSLAFVGVVREYLNAK